MESNYLEQAIKIAVHAHSGQVDKLGKPYILHPLRVMHYFQTESLQAIGVLHDVLEDSDITLDDLRDAGIPVLVRETVQVLTKTDSESYSDYIARVGLYADARAVKIADLDDNIRRLSLYSILDLTDAARLHKKYIQAKEILMWIRS